MKYDVYFELYGKKLKTTVDAASEESARDIVRQKIIFHKVACVKDETVDHGKDLFNDIMNFIDDL